MKDDNNSREKMAYVEERSMCEKIGNDPEKVKKRIAYLEMHLNALINIYESGDYRK